MSKPGHEQPLLDNTRSDDLFSAQPLAEAPAATPAPIQEEVSGVSVHHLLPRKTKERMEAEEAEKERLLDRRDNMGQFNNVINRAEVGMETVEDTDRTDAASIRKRANLSKGRPKQDRRNLGAAGKRIADQAPQHIVDEHPETRY